ncbi:Rv3235 family protein [Pseudonocardia sp. WMMC193]|uniref:Rv3235 family protein n=1 Tax=Pseudonocardia sp. WMMC193 TaxID=2911965 RepID=UPI001F23A92A|nr:Rv3235 family protein [Pseudonocardia sp. WMMC193]MCF7550919.1 Rv3235 family protein [Pseudonocardia sp. WMMC193]
MTITHDHEETTQDILRGALGLTPRHRYIWDGKDLIEPCGECGHNPILYVPAPLPAGDPVTDVVPDPEALREASVTVTMLVEVLDQRRAARQVRDRVHPRVLPYLQAVPADAIGSHGAARLLHVRPVQPHEGAVEVAATIRLRGRRRALAASFELHNSWICQPIRIL